jgi:hypothetical protein
MRIKFLDQINTPAPGFHVPVSRAKPFSLWATVTYAVLAVAASLYIMRGYWAGSRLATLYHPVHTANWVVTVNMLVHDGVRHLPSPLRGFAALFSDMDELVEDSAETLREVIEFVSTNDPGGAAKLRAQLVVLLSETGSATEALSLLSQLDDPAASEFRLAVRAVYGTNSPSSVPSLLGTRPFEYLESSWAAWRFQCRWHAFAGETSHAMWVNQWLDHRARNKSIIVLAFTMICVLLICFGLGLLFWMLRPEARRVFPIDPVPSLAFGEGFGIFVRANVITTLLLLVLSLHPLTRVSSMCRGLIMLAPLLFLLARRHWRFGSLANFFGAPASRRMSLALIVAAICVLGLDWLSLLGVGPLAERFGIETHWTEGLDEALLYEQWPMRLVPLINGILWSPVYEEMAFRGVLFPALRDRFGLFLGAAMSAIVFASLHFYSLPGFLSITLFGFVNALVCHYTRSLIPSIIAHICTNLIILGTQTALFV